jgi:hypothetical protein
MTRLDVVGVLVSAVVGRGIRALSLSMLIGLWPDEIAER